MIILYRVLLYIAIGLLVENLSNPNNTSVPNIFIVLIWPVLIILVACDLLIRFLNFIKYRALENAKSYQNNETIVEEEDGWDDLDI